MDKPIQVKPGLYAIFYEHLKQIAHEYGYNLVLHGSMQRDLDLIAIPWIEKPKSDSKMIVDFEEYLTGKRTINPYYTVLPGGRKAYVIELNRGDKHGEWVRFEDKQYYLDISVTSIGAVELWNPEQNVL